MRTLIAAMSLAALLAACQSQAPQTPPDVPSARNIRANVAYNCDSGVAFTASFLVSPDAVDLHYQDGAVGIAHFRRPVDAPSGADGAFAPRRRARSGT